MATADFPRDAIIAPSQFSPQNGSALQARLQGLAKRRNAQRLWNRLIRALCVGVSLAALVMLLHRFYIIDAPFWLPPLLVAAAALFGIFDGLRNRAGTFEAALDADRVLGLRERLSSALIFVAPDTKVPREYSPENTPLVPALVDDAATRAAELDPRRVYPLRVGRAARVLAVATIALAAFTFMPNNNFFRSPEQRALAATLKTDGKDLETIAKQVRERKDVPTESEANRTAKKLEALGRKMQRGRMTKKETLLALGDMKQDIEKTRKVDQDGSGGVANLQQVEEQLKQEEMQSQEGQQMQREMENNDLKKAADQLDKLADKMEKGEMTPQEKEKAASDLEKAAKALRENGNEDAAKKLEEAAKQLRKENQGQQNGGQKQGGQQQKNGQQKNGQQQQGGQQGQQKNGQQKQGNQQGNQQGGQQNQGQKGGQKNQQSGSQQGSQGGQQSQGQKGQQGSSGGANGLRDLANGMRNGSSGNNQAMNDMLNKIRNAEKNTGQGNQSGQQGQGGQSGNDGQKGQGQGGTPQLAPSDPHGQVGGGAGLGPRNNATGSAKGGGVSKLRGGTGSKDKRRWADQWSNSLPKTQKKISRITGKMGDNGEVDQLPTRTEAKGGQVNTPYYDVPESYQHEAEDAIGKEAVPPAYKQPVKDYFDSWKK